ncbi:MAG TPA: hypothetical protein VM571_14170 [Noviherbaspirillum sp.]|nr:hypothetical protein [Noviherbaspirillum sp.]
MTTTSRRGPRWANRLAIVALLALVLGPLTFVGTRMEIAAWHAARGVDAMWAGEHAAAVAHYNQALDWNPDSAAYLAARAKAEIELGQFSEAVKDALRATELAPNNVPAQHIYTTALLRAGRGKEAAAFFEDQLPYLGIYDDAQRASLQNNIAATLATANLDLDRALKHIEEALAAAAKDDNDQRISHQIQAVVDRQRIRDLGFTPEESLF